ncbi:hypothetical protein EUX98_g4497 [Antrodiella citrinella]|uniref:BTB domain-containing protein n=1 Tax=Antrodiella citrinella TaxID=2447956 RepID=A0A4S4MTU3_9APHY|nr:hypothetical protein EUX98_g4497 [Antrodiella citrinella]
MLTNETLEVAYATHPFDNTDTDLILQSSDAVQFSVYKVILSLASPVFHDMFVLGSPIQGPSGDIPILQLPESSDLLDKFLRLVYPIENPSLVKISDVADALEVSLKYQTLAVTIHLSSLLRGFIDDSPLAVFAVSCRLDLEFEAKMAALRIATHPETLPRPFQYVPEMDHISAAAYFRLRWHLSTPLASSKKRSKASQTPGAPLPAHWTRKHFSFVCRDPNDCIPVSAGINVAAPSVSPVTSLATEWLDSGLFLHHPADIILRSSDAGTDFIAHRIILSIMAPKLVETIASSVTPSPLNPDLPVVETSETPQLLYMLLHSCYGTSLRFSENVAMDMAQFIPLVRAAKKYDMAGTIEWARSNLQGRISVAPIRVYFIAILLAWTDVARAAAQFAVIDSNIPDMAKVYVPEMEDVGAKSYYNLLQYDSAVKSAIQNVVDTYNARTLRSYENYKHVGGWSTNDTPLLFKIAKVSLAILERERTLYGSDVYLPRLVEESQNMDAALQTAIAQVELAFS